MRNLVRLLGLKREINTLLPTALSNWDSILQRINLTSKNIQRSTINLSAIVPLYNSLFDFMQLFLFVPGPKTLNQALPML